MSATRTLTVLLENCEVLPAQLHRVEAARAAAAGDTNRLAELAARRDAPGDLLDRYAAMVDPKIRAAYLSRPGRALPAPERNAAVLTAALEACPDRATVDTALAALEAKPTKVMARALLRKAPAEWLTPQQAYLVLSRAPELKTSGRWGVTPQRVAQVAARCGPDLSHRLLEDCTCPVRLAGLALLPVDHQVLRAAVTSTRAQMRRRRATDSGPKPWLITALRSQHRTPAEADELVELIRDSIDGYSFLVASMLGPHVPHPGGWDTRPVPAPEPVTGATVQTLSSDPQVLTRTVDAVLTDPAGPHGKLLLELLCNPYLPPEDRSRVVDALRGYPGMHMAVVTRDILGLNHDDDQVRDLLVSEAPLATLQRYGWEPFGGPDNAAAVATRLWRQEADRAPVPAAVAQARPPRSTWPHMPWQLLLQMAAPRIHGEPIAAWIADELAKLVDTDPAAWQALTSLADEFDGSFTDLITTCQAIAA
jgi:hypothetical protein